MKDKQEGFFDVTNKVAEIMDENRWTQYQLSKRTKIPQSTIATWFRRKSQPTYKMIVKICRACGMSLEDFFRRKKSKEESMEEREGRLYLRVRRRLPDEQKVFLHDLLIFTDSWLHDRGFE